MNVILFGATGMLGQGVLRECLLDSRVERVLLVGRISTGQTHEKLCELIHPNFFDFSSVEAELSGYDACFFSLGVSAAGMTEEAYKHITYDITIAAARTLIAQNTSMTFIYVSGLGTDSSERGSTMWARVKGQTENALLRMPFKAVYLFRPGLVQPVHGERSKTRLYRITYTMLKPFYPIWKTLFPSYVTTTEHIGRAMIEVAEHGAPTPILESRTIRRIAAMNRG